MHKKSEDRKKEKSHREILGIFFDGRPGILSLILFVLSGAVLACSLKWQQLNLFRSWGTSDALTVLAAVAGVAAILAGFASILVSYVMSADSAVMRSFRSQLGSLGRRNWNAVVVSPFAASFLSIVAMFTVPYMERAVAFAIIVWSLLEIFHGFVRTMRIQINLLSVLNVKDSSGAIERNVAGADYFDVDS